MTEPSPVPTGRLKIVRRDWEYSPGFVMTPLREIAFNSRLSKQARLVWMWLASVPVRPTRISWGECETMLDCGTKARRHCISQLVTEGYVSVHDDGTVVMHNPYQVYDAKRIEVLNEIRSEWIEGQDLPLHEPEGSSAREKALLEKRIDDSLREFKLEPAPVEKQVKKGKQQKPLIRDVIVEAWNKCKPESYSSIRTVSTKQQECIEKHLKNLGLDSSQAEEFICSVCNGLKKSQFWTQTVYKSGRNFNAVFGYGNPQDTKMKNIENLYSLSQDEVDNLPEIINVDFNSEQQELIDTYKYINLNYTNSKAREDESEMERWSTHLADVINQLKQANINPETL